MTSIPGTWYSIATSTPTPDINNTTNTVHITLIEVCTHSKTTLATNINSTIEIYLILLEHYYSYYYY